VNPIEEAKMFNAWIHSPSCPLPGLTQRERFIAWVAWQVARGAMADVAVNYPPREAPVAPPAPVMVERPTTTCIGWVKEAIDEHDEKWAAAIRAAGGEVDNG